MLRPWSAAGLARFAAVIAFVTLGAAGVAASAQWPCNGVPLCTAGGDQSSASACSDSSGGAIVVWCDTRAGNQDIYAQRVNGNGALQWAAAGVAVCTAAGSQNSPTAVSDGNHGAFVVWSDARTPTAPNFYVQHVTSGGVVDPLWPVNGLNVCTAAAYPYNPTVATDGVGGVIVAWEDYRNPSGDIYAQRLNASGAMQWPSSGEPVCTAANDQGTPDVVPDGSGGALFAWKDQRAGGSIDIYVQHVDPTGAPLWTVNGVAANLTVGLRDAEAPSLAADGSGGAIVTWQDRRNGSDYDIYTLRFTSAGSAAGTGSWITGGVPICTAIGDQISPLSISDGAGGAILQWLDYRNGPASDLAAQRVTGSGDVADGWPVDGSGVCTAPDNQLLPAIVPDGSAGLLTTWTDYRGGPSTKVYGQRLLSTAAVAPGWPANGVPAATSSAVQQQSSPVPDGANGAIVAWQDNRTGVYRVYATRIIAAGGVLDAPPEAIVDFRLREPWPNPASGTTTFAFELPAERPVEAGVFDLAGRRVRTLEPGRMFPAGAHRLAWDGRDEAGKPAEPGVYLVRVRAGADAQVRRVVRLR